MDYFIAKLEIMDSRKNQWTNVIPIDLDSPANVNNGNLIYILQYPDPYDTLQMSSSNCGIVGERNYPYSI